VRGRVDHRQRTETTHVAVLERIADALGVAPGADGPAIDLRSGPQGSRPPILVGPSMVRDCANCGW
jgi:hypothetical protein